MNEQKIKELAVKFGTPSYIFDTESVAARAGRIREILGDRIHLCYSIKANPFLVSAILPCVDRLEVCSPGELAICEERGVPGDAILYSGVCKLPEDIREAVRYGAGIYTAESVHQFELVHAEAEKQEKTLPILLRINVGSQFGMSREDLLYLIDHRAEYPHLSIEGIHCFGGTQRKNLRFQRQELSMLRDLFEEVREKHHFTLKKLEYGTGLPVPYFEGDDFEDPFRLLEELAPDLAAAADYADVTVEMGRFFASPCGYYLTRVCDIKHVGDAHYALVDGGIHHIHYDGQMMGMKVPKMLHLRQSSGQSSGDGEEGKTLPWTICGSLCTTNDVLVRRVVLTDLKLGDVLCFENLGAYSVTEAMTLFLSRTLPRVVLYDGCSGRLARDFKEAWRLNTEE